MKIEHIEFHRYKAFKNFSVALSDFDVLVGPNNAGKSTVLGAFRILAEGLRKANSKLADRVNGPDGSVYGYSLDLEDIPISLENVFHDYDESKPSTIRFHLDNGYKLLLYFPARGECSLIPDCGGTVNTPTLFRKYFPIKIGFVPVLGPVEHRERLFLADAAKKALHTYRASRNFRNIWFHFSDDFLAFRDLVKSTWPGMDIKPPEVIREPEGPILAMFCPEEKVPREIFWAGFGFQVWCQMLTFIIQSRGVQVFIIDEPDIYLHSDLQRQLVHILRDLGPQIILATHSVEIISEVESKSLLSINKKRNSATRISNPGELRLVYELLGSNSNPVLTQVAKTRKIVFLEGLDFQILSLFARKLGYTTLANRSEFSVVSVGGFNPNKVKNLAEGIEITLGMKISRCALFDRDYRYTMEVEKIKDELNKFCKLVYIHERKEIENYLLNPVVIDRAISQELKRKFPNKETTLETSSEQIIDRISAEMKNAILSNIISERKRFAKDNPTGISETTYIKECIDNFESEWSTFEGRSRLVPGKETLTRLNEWLQSNLKISLTPRVIIDSFTKLDMDSNLITILQNIKRFSETPVE